jgi:hypothetical protein
MNVRELANVLNDAAKDFAIGKLQEIRKELRGLDRLPGRTIFASRSINDEWACHWGGRTELQFNIGIDEGVMRHGVAFSLEPSQALPTIAPLIPKIARFNEFVATQASKLAGYEMWHWENSGYRSENGPAQPISAELVEVGNFIFLGKIQPIEAINIEAVLNDFDYLLELYLFVEDTNVVIRETPLDASYKGSLEWKFKAGHTPYARSQTATYTERTLDVDLRHNWLQTQIHNALCSEYGKDFVGTEQRSISNGEIDFVIEKPGWRVIAELKISARVMTCVRDALGQLFEYAYYGMPEEPSEVWVIGTGKCTPAEILYLKQLRTRLGIPLFYRRFDEDLGMLEMPV